MRGGRHIQQIEEMIRSRYRVTSLNYKLGHRILSKRKEKKFKLSKMSTSVKHKPLKILLNC